VSFKISRALTSFLIAFLIVSVLLVIGFCVLAYITMLTQPLENWWFMKILTLDRWWWLLLSTLFYGVILLLAFLLYRRSTVKAKIILR